ncbi:Prephenate dehydrogenase [Ruminiclostridium papyrosolvens DSM 2782]|uniref:Prephenate dehydrogenase n=1 Tax=Ruminiclostridium papyrosolvens DSM 2782 TaxID=588581 RepID=F1TGX0_9FIRM|nr:prephenate dehydrogenase [Ruminiclostridium papyrosolvens]EGD46451.1 Prephenate dehydrogenase [Ruminiclostridium papyrosolvens DSM 2782]WES33935.1 prephenate dehydrogenase [Ruminiclostridium papyrosolvens DSM 2782]
MDVKSISIIGLGLIGGSLAKAFSHEFTDLKIYAVDNCTESIGLAEKEGVLNKGFSICCEEIWNSDIIFICTPVSKTIEYVNELSSKIKKGSILTDVASTKGELFNYIDGLENPPLFVGGHPMAGTEKSGYVNSIAHMFENAYYVLTPTKSSSEDAISTMENLLRKIGALPIVVSSKEHDTVTGCISHVPHIIASALVSLAKNNENSHGLIKLLAAGGFKDITRIASSNPSMWKDVVISNGPVVVKLLEDFKHIVDSMIDNIKSSENKEIYSFFDNAKAFRDGFSNTATGLLPKNFELIVDVTDEPGIIGKIATLLGNSGINIKNINVSNSREYEQGCLKITLSDQANTDKAYEILEASSYMVFRKD